MSETEKGLNVLELLKISPRTGPELCDILKVSRQRVDQIVKLLMDSGKIKREKPYKSNYIYYIPECHEINNLLSDKIIEILSSMPINDYVLRSEIPTSNEILNFMAEQNLIEIKRIGVYKCVILTDTGKNHPKYEVDHEKYPIIERENIDHVITNPNNKHILFAIRKLITNETQACSVKDIINEIRGVVPETINIASYLDRLSKTGYLHKRPQNSQSERNWFEYYLTPKGKQRIRNL